MPLKNKSKNTPEPAYRVPALEKGLDILELLAGSFVPLSLTELSRACGRKVSEMQRMVNCLHTRGFLLRDSLGGYRLSSRMYRLACMQPPIQHLLSRAMPHMEQFVAQVSESVHLSVLEQDNMLVLGESAGYYADAVRISVRTGSLHLAEETVSGRLLLSGMKPETFKGFVLRRQLAGKTLAALQARLETIRQMGCDGGASAQIPGVHDLGVLVMAGGTEPVAALTTTYLSSHENPKTTETLLAALREAADKIGREMETFPAGA